MLVLRILIGLGLAYLVLLLLAWRFQDRLAFPAPRASLPDPRQVGVENGETVELVSGDGTKLVGWYLSSTALHRPRPRFSGSTATGRTSPRSGPSCVRSSRRGRQCWCSTTRATEAAAAGPRSRPCTPRPTPRTPRSSPARTWTRDAFTCMAARSAARPQRTPPRTEIGRA